MINPAVQQFMTSRVRARVGSYEVDHTLMVTEREVVTEFVLEAV